MRVALTKGRVDPECEATFAPGLTKKPPFYFFSQIIRDVENACRGNGWEVDTFRVGRPGPQRLPVPDVVVNLITEPLVCRRALAQLESIVHAKGVPLINSVESVRRSGRTALPGVIRDSRAARVRVPLTTRYTGKPGGLESHIEAAGHRFPVLFRPVGTHSSKGLVKVDNGAQLRTLGVPSDLLVTDFVDFRSGDGLYRKYRMIWANETTYRRHVIAGLDWNVTGQARADMWERPETIIAEKAFLASSDALNDRIAELFRIVGLDFGVIDFAVSDVGEIIVFELNGTFQVSRSIPARYVKEWGYLEANNATIIAALVASIASRAAKSAVQGSQQGAR